jgi:membrane protease YdiL (CAAX protease family)
VEDTFSNGKILSGKSYVVVLLIIFAAVYSQYLVHLGTILGFLVVYGIPVAVISAVFGREIIRKARNNSGKAFKLGLGLFGAFTVAGIVLSMIALIVILILDPTAVLLLNRPNPVLQIPPSIAWVMTGLSILIVGPAEEYMFRGFLYGGLLSVFRGKHWISLAILSSVIFMAVHLYYVITYGVASAVPLIDLTTFGMAMAMTYYLTGGNIVAPALIHGVYDATGFIGVASSMTIGLILRATLLGIAVIFAAIYIRRENLQPEILPSAGKTNDTAQPTAPTPEANKAPATSYTHFVRTNLRRSSGFDNTNNRRAANCSQKNRLNRFMMTA